MARRVDLFDSTYRHFNAPVLDAIRKETFGVDIGQNSGTAADEQTAWRCFATGIACFAMVAAHCSPIRSC